ncbi:MAG: NYN domain-containing protein [Chloroflexi bacterium]|nr:NYN domain-containing protein [Chloroflexota bacterium]
MTEESVQLAAVDPNVRRRQAVESRPDGRQRFKTALFVDFDTIYSELKKQDPIAAESFATSPSSWIRWLETDGPLPIDMLEGRIRRSVLIRRCYLNPGMFGKYRPYFVRAGFQVVDCPPFTSQGKNGADIQMVMDILDALEHRTEFDEFILFSGDSDFTPVLLRLRGHDRRTMILAAGPSAAAYRAACDVVLTDDVFIERALGEQPSSPDTRSVAPSRGYDAGFKSDPPVPASGARSVVRSVMGSFAVSEEIKDQARLIIRSVVAKSDRPVPSATVAWALTNTIGTRLRESDWAGTGGFREFVTAIGNLGVAVSWSTPGFFYDPERHDLPPTPGTPPELVIGDPDLHALAQRIHRLTDVPLLTPEEYAAVFEIIAGEVNENGYFLTETSKAVRDMCRSRGVDASHQDVNFILKGIVGMFQIMPPIG